MRKADLTARGASRSECVDLDQPVAGFTANRQANEIGLLRCSKHNEKSIKWVLMLYTHLKTYQKSI